MKKLILGLILLSLLLVLMPLSSAADNATQNNTICIHYFYREGCHFCTQAAPYMESLSQNYSINIYKHDVQSAEGYNIYDKLCGLQNIPIQDRGVPLVAVGDKIFIGLDQIQNNLEPEIQRLQNLSDYKCLLKEFCQQANQTSAGTEPLINISKVTLPLITVSAVADSINPCAIGVLIFLISFLFVSSNQNKKRTFIIASIYIITVYLTYLLAGIEILAFLSKLSFLTFINKIFAVAVIIFGLFSIRDAVKNKAFLAIPEKAKPLIERWVYKVSIPAAIVLGIIVAAVELPCTGGMYMAILTLLANTATKTQAVWYLLYYNLIFVMPLILITFLFIKGLEGNKVHGWIDRHKKKTRLLVGIILIILGLILFFI